MSKIPRDKGEPYAVILGTVKRLFPEQMEQSALCAGVRLFEQADESDAMYLVVSGWLEAAVSGEDGREVVVAEIGPGEIVGEAGVLGGHRRSSTVRAAKDSELLRIPAEAAQKLARESPGEVEHLLGLTLLCRRSRKLHEILHQIFRELDDDALGQIESEAQWLSLHGGEYLFRIGDAGDAIYIVVSGRLRAVATDAEGGEKVLNEIRGGETIGEISILTDEPRSASVYAIRDSVLVKLSNEASMRITRQCPQILVNISRLLIQRLRRSEGTLQAPSSGMSIALISAGPTVQLSRFAERLAAALSAFGACLHLSSRRLESIFGLKGVAETTPDGQLESRLLSWLDRQEMEHFFMLYEADDSLTAWTRRCIRQADRIVLVADADGDPLQGETETRLHAEEEMAKRASRALVLLHPEELLLPSRTNRWLASRDVDIHCHIRWNADADLSGLARQLTGRGVGVALGGGGARGFAHIGVLRALREARVPVDFIGGTSMGAIISAMYACGWDYAKMIQVGLKGVVHSGAFQEYTLPVLSLIRSRILDREIRAHFGEAHIEDLWVNFFAVSTNLTTTQMTLHRQGPLWRAIRASVSLPGILAPVLEAGNVLVDGGVLDNLPGDLMREISGGSVIVVDVGDRGDMRIDIDDFPSPWQMLCSKVLKRGATRRLPTMADVLMRTLMVSSVHRAIDVASKADLLLCPPVQKYGLLEFDKVEQIAEEGYRYAKTRLDELQGSELYGNLVGR